MHFLNGLKKIINIINRREFSRELEENNEIISQARKKIILIDVIIINHKDFIFKQMN